MTRPSSAAPVLAVHGAHGSPVERLEVIISVHQLRHESLARKRGLLPALARPSLMRWPGGDAE